jgi:autotransporter-associated beta strand protein
MSARVSARIASSTFNRISSARKATLLAAAVLALPAGKSWGAAQSGTYTSTTSGGTWSNAGNWQSGLVAGGNSGSIGTSDGTTGNFSVAYFNTSTLTGPTTVHLDATQNLSVLAFGDVGNAYGWTLDNNGSNGNIITLNGNSYHGSPGGSAPNTNSLPEIYVGNQSVNITAVVQVTGNGYQGVAWEVAGNGTLSLNNASDSWQGGLYMTGGSSLTTPLTFNVNIGSGTVVGSTNTTSDYYSKNKIYIGQAGTDFLNLNISSGTVGGSAIQVGVAGGGYATITVGASAGLNSGGEGGVGLLFPSASSNAGSSTLNVAGNVGLFNNSTMTAGGYYGRALTINQTAGLFAFYSDNAGTLRGGTGYWYNKGGTETLNLSGGTFSVPNLLFLGNAGGQGGGTTAINLNGGTLQTTGSGNFVTNFNYSSSGVLASSSSGGLGTLALNVQSGGGNLDPYGGSVTMNAPFLHSGTGTDGGITLNDSATTPGSLTITGSNTYTGPTGIARGTLTLASGASIATSNAIKIGSAGNFNVSALSGPYTMLSTQPISGIGTITGALSTATGATLTAGLNGNGGALTVTGPLTLNGGTTAFNLISSSGGANGLINANGGLSVTAATTVDAIFSVLPVSSQTYVLYNYSGTTLSSGAQSNLSLSLAGSAAGYNAALFALNYNTSGQVDLVYTPASGASSNLIWASHSSGAWDVAGSTNWTNGSSGSVANSTFHQGDNVTFDDTNGVQQAITLNTTVTPGTVTDSANSNNFSITGSGKISGATNLTMSGTGTLTLGTANDFTGTTFLNSGTIIATNTAGSATGATGVIIASGATLRIGDNATTGAGVITGSISDGGSLVINRPDSSTLPTGITGGGSVTFAGSGTTLISAQPGYTGATNISAGTVQYGLTNALPSGTAVTLSGTGTLNMANFGQTFNNVVTSSTGTNINLGTGNITFNTTSPNILQGQITGNASSGSINLAGTSSVSLSNNVTTGTLALANNNADNVTLNVAPGANITVGSLNVGASGTANGGSGVINQTGGLITAANFNLAGTSTVTNGAIGTYNLSAGTLNVSTGLTTAQSQNSKAFINISGTGTINMLGNSALVLGQYYGTPTTINQTGGLIRFASGNTGGVQISGESADVYNLSGGTLSVPKFTFVGQALNNSYGPTNPTLYFNGGILQTSAASTAVFPADVFVTANGTQNAGGITGASAHFSTVVSAGGAIIDTDGNAVTLTNNMAHDTTHLGSSPDGGLTLNDSAATPGVLTLNAANSYTGPTTITRGTLALGPTGSIISSPTIYVGANGNFNVSAQSGYSPASSQFLTGVGTVTGLASFSSGYITGGTNGSAGTLTFNTPLTLAGGTSLFDLASTSAGPNDLLVASGGLNVSGGSVIDAVFATTPTSTQTYVLYNYSGTTLSAGAKSLLSLSTAGSAGGITVHNLGLSYNTNQILLTFTPGAGSAATLTWASTSSNSWDTALTNWHNATTGGTAANSVFFNGDNVTFDDSIPGVKTNIVINTAASPGSFNVSSNTNNYNFSGAGTISGSTGLNKTGSSNLILGTSNSFTGPTDLNGGITIAVNPAGSATGVTSTTIESNTTLQIGDGVTTGVGDVSGAITNNGTLLIDRPDTFTFPGSVSGNAFVQEGAGTTILTGSNTYSGDTNIVAGKLQLGVNNALPTGTNLNTGNAVGSGFNLASYNQTINDLNGGVNSTLNLGSGTLTIGGGDTMSFAGPILGTTSSQIVMTVGAGNYGGGTLNLSNNVSTGTLSIGPGDGDTENVNISAGNVTLSNLLLASGSGTGGTANVVQSGGTVNVGHLQIGNASSVSGNIFTSYTLSGGTLNVSGTLNMATSQNVVSSVLTIGTGATLNMTGNNSMVLGDYYGSPASIVQNGGTVAWTLSNSSGGLQVDGGGTYSYTLNGGELSIPRIVWGGQASTSQYGSAKASFEFNGGTLQVLSSGVFFPAQVSVSTARWTTTIGSGGATIDTAGNAVLFTNGLVTDPSTSTDGGLTKIGAGTLTLSGSDTYNGPTNVSAGTLALTTNASLPVGGALNISSGATVSVPNHGGLATVVPVVGHFSNSGTVDLTNNAMRFTNSSEGAITTQVAAAYNHGNWNGSAAGIITSSVAAADTSHLTAIGISTGINSFEGATVNPTDVLIKYTYYGDATLDGSVTSADYTLIDNGFLSHATGWQNGDFNYDNVVNGSDYTLIDNAFNTQGALIASQIASPTAQVAGGASAVPEPTSLGLLTLGAMGILGRRNRRRR